MKRHKIALIIIAVSVLLAGLNFSTVPFSGGDNFAYFLLGKALAHGQGYIELWDANNTLHTKYPPMFPILLIPAGLFDSYLMAKATVFVCYVLMLWFAYKLYEAINGKNKRATLVALAILAFAPVTIQYSSFVLSEIPYMMFSMIALYLFTQKKYWLSMIFATLTFLTRTAGIMLLVAMSFIYVLDRRRYE
jgi:Gpi18-like mannosyltransferase